MRKNLITNQCLGAKCSCKNVNVISKATFEDQQWALGCWLLYCSVVAFNTCSQKTALAVTIKCYILQSPHSTGITTNPTLKRFRVLPFLAMKRSLHQQGLYMLAHHLNKLFGQHGLGGTLTTWSGLFVQKPQAKVKKYLQYDCLRPSLQQQNRPSDSVFLKKVKLISLLSYSDFFSIFISFALIGPWWGKAKDLAQSLFAPC